MGEKICTLGLDIGTTSIKVVAYASDATQIAQTSARVETHSDETGAAVQDPDIIYQAVMKALAEVISETKQADYQVSAVGFSTAMHSLIPLCQDDVPTGPAMTWLDSRPHEEAQSIWNTPIGKDIYTHTGTPVHAMSPLVKIAWLKGHDANQFAKIARFASIKEYIWHRWFEVWEVDYAMASATGLFDIARCEWYSEALKYLEIDTSYLSAPVPTSHLRCPHADSPLIQIGFSPDTAFCIGGSDGVLASLAAGAITHDTMVLTVGTSLALRTGFSEPRVDTETRSFCYILDDNHYIIGAPSNSGGVVLDWLYRNILTEQGEEFKTRFPALCSAAGEENIGDLLCVPYVAGERAPLWDEGATASFVGLKLHHTQTSMMRAAIEGILFNAYWLGERLMGYVGKPKRLVVSGKLFEQEWIAQFTADLFDIEILCEDDFDGATLGAAAVANAALKRAPITRQRNSEPTLLQPRPEQTTQLRSKFSAYKRLCRTLLGVSFE